MRNQIMRADEARRESPARTTLIRPISVTADDEREFLLAMDFYKRTSGRQFPTWSEILEVLRSIGYAKRIWKPVAAWSPVDPSTTGRASEGTEAAGTVGCFSKVKSPL